ncbi:MAG: PAS domain S-box protein [Chitinophagaceae bacterium]
MENYNGNLSGGGEEFKILFEQAPDAVVAINEANTIIFWNRKAEQIFGWTTEEVIGQDLTVTIVPVPYREAHNNGMHRYLHTGEIRVLNRTIEVPAINKQDEEFFIALTIAKTKLKGSTAFLAFIRDITDQRRNQEALESRTKELKHSNTNLEHFARAASHDLKEPIRKVHVFADRLKQLLADRLTEHEQYLFSRIQTAANRMSALIDNLMAFSYVSVNDLEAEEVNLTGLVQSVLGDLELLIEEKHAKIKVGPLPSIKGFRIQLQQLFQNVISNALKYSTPDTEPAIDIRAYVIKGINAPLPIFTEERTKRFHVIEVKDNGIGFKQSDAEKIFQIFQRLHGHADYAGTGIGLAIAQRVVEIHQGCILAQSEPGQGATFKIILPAADPEPGTDLTLAAIA